MKYKQYVTVVIIIIFGLFTGGLYSEDKDDGQVIIIAPPPAPLAIYELPSFSLVTADDEPHFLKITVVLGFDESPELKKEIKSKKTEIQHIISILLQGKKYEDLDTVSDTISLAEEIKAYINMRLVTGKIKEIYFKEFNLN